MSDNKRDLLVFSVSSGVCSFKDSFLDISVFGPMNLFFNTCKVIFISPFCQVVIQSKHLGST